VSTQSNPLPLAGGPTDGEGRGAFVRQSSGLVREFSMSDVISINLVGINLGTPVALGVTALALLWAGASMVPVVIIGAIISLATVTVYGMMSAAMPRSGGDYVFVGRSLSPVLGFLANWMMTWSLFVLFGLFSVGTITQALAPAMSAFGHVAGSTWFVNAANDLVAHKGTLAVAAIILIVTCAAISLAGDKAIKYAFRVLVITGMLGIGVIIVMLLSTSHQSAANHLNSILTANGGKTLAGMRAAAAAHGFTGAPFSWSQTFAALPYAFYAFVGVTYTTYLGGEIQKPQRTQPLGMLIALIIGCVAYVLLFSGLYRTLGWNNIQSWAYLTNNEPGALSGFFQGSPYGPFLLGGMTSSPVLAFIMIPTFFAWFFALLLFALVMPIRNIFAWSMDRVVPEWVSKVGPRGTPWASTLIVSVIALGVTFVAVYSNFLSLVVNYTLFYAITFLIAGIAAAAFPYRRRDVFERAPRSIQRRVAGVPVLTIAGVIQAICFMVIIYEALKSPAFGGPTGRNALIFIGGLIVAAPIIFYVSRAIRKRQGYDVDAVWKTLPPE
jgi:APA family basic amino acid/polyamine antiporter